MPDKKYLIEIPGMPEGSDVWDSDKWERNKEAFMADYPEANVFELGEYDAEDTNENDQIMLTFENDPDSSGVWDSDKWERNKEAFTEDYPDAKVNRVRYVDYWGNAAQENRVKREKLIQPDAERDARLAELGYYDDQSALHKDFSAMGLDSSMLKPVSSAIKHNSVSGEITYLDPKVAEFFANDSAYTERVAEIARLDSEYESNPSVVAKKEYAKQAQEKQQAYIDESIASIREDMKNEVNDLEAGKGAFYKYSSAHNGTGDAAIVLQAIDFLKGKDAGRSYIENEYKETYDSAIKLFEKAKQANEVAGKGFWDATGDVAMDKLRDLATQSDIEAYNQIGDILSRLEAKLGNLNEVTEEDINNNLSKAEQALIKGFFAYNDAMANAQQDMSQVYKGGKIFGESVGFMLEFLATGGLAGGGGKAAGNAVGKGLAKWAQKAAKKTTDRAVRTFATKAARKLTEVGAGTLARTVAAPGTYKKMAEESVKIENGHLDRSANAFKGFADSYIENLSEISGGVIGKSLKLAGINPSKVLGNISFEKVGKILADNSVMQAIAKGGKALFGENGVLKKAGFNGIFEEVEEEYIGNLIRELTIQPGALEEMHKDGNFGAMLIGFAPMTLFGAGMSAASIGAKNIEAANLGKKLRENLSLHYSDQQIDHMMNLVSDAENADQVWEAIKPLAVGLSAEETQQMYQYGAFMAQNKAMLFAKKAQDDNLAQAKRNEAEQTYGKFWQETAEGAESVQLATLNDGRSVFVLSEPTADGVVSIIDANTGEKGFTNVSNYKIQEVDGEATTMTQSWSMDAYLEGSIAADRMTAEQARMTREYDEQVKNLQSQIREGTQINLGTEGSPVILLATGKFVKDGVVAVDQTGNVHTVGWMQVADAMKQPIKVKTDQQIVDEEIAGIVARNAERRKKMSNATPAMTEAVNESVAQASEVVAQETEHIPLNEDGTVNEATFWEQDPEGYAQWNDEQNQDGGADTIQQIEAAKAELTAMLNEAQQATLTSNPANRKAAKREVNRLAERLARLEALEQSYADRALAPLRERAQMWADLTGAQVHVVETEEELAAISATAASENAKLGSRVRGFAKDGRAYIFLPGITDVKEIDEVFFHEAVAHNGLKGLLGEEKYKQLCEQVWNMMSQAARDQFIRYPGVNGDYLAAADEYIAHIAEKMGANIATAEEKTIWQKIIAFVRDVLRAMGIEIKLTEQELSDLLHQAYADLANNMAKAEQIATGEAMSAVEEAPSEARQQYDALLADLTPEEIEAVAENDFNAAQEAYNAYMANAPKVEPGESSKAYIERKKAYNDELKRLEAELNAQQALMDEITAIKAANAPVLTDVEILEQDGFGVDTQNDDVRMSVRYTPTDEQKEAIINSIVNVTGRSREEAERWLASETSLAAMINDDLQYLDYVADPKYKAIKDNSDYPQGTVDFNNICRKRVPFTRMFTRLQRTFPNRVFTADELADIRTIMSKDGLTVACGLCYVEDRRQMVGEVAQPFIDGIQEGFETYANNPTKRKNAEKFKALIGEDAYVPQVYDLTTQEGLDKLYNEHRGIWEAFQAFNNARGQQSQNLLQGYAEYKREILSWSDKKVKQVNDNGGLRIFSYSDFEAHHLIDVVQIIIDCASKGVKIQGYTKVPAFARAVANTGIKLNRSLIPLGDTGLVDGQLAFDPVEGIDINDPDFLESNDNVGNILIGINDEQIRVAMNDPRIHYIIPYHARQKENIRQKLNVGAWTNYISTQNERNISDGKRVKDNINIYTDILTEDITTDRQFVEKYLQLCAEQGRIPKFDQFLDKDAEGNYVYTPGYYKFLIDFKLFDENGNILPQQPVVAEFDDAFNMQILENYAKDERESTGEQMNETYDKIVDALGLDESAAEGEDVRFSKKTKAPETAVQPMAGHSTVVSSADGANIIKNLETLLEEYRNKPSNRQKTFIGDLARALGLRNNGNHSNYGTFEAVNGEVFTYRISDHNSSTKNMEDAGNPNGISIVITHRPNSKITKDGNAHIVEFYYNTQKLLNADGQPYADIIQSVIQSLYSGEYKDTTGLAEMDEAVSFSVITPQMDADYLAAVERGDMETAQRMVLEAAKLAMPNTKVVDKKGNPAVVHHGTKGKFNTFAYSREDIGFHFGTKGTARTRIGRGKDARIMQVFLNLENPLIFDTDLGSWDADYIVKDLLKKEMMSYDDAKAILLTPNGYKRNSVSALVDLRQWMSNNGYDGIVYPNWYESDGKDSYIAFNRNQIKSADSVTYDNNGNVIPLSQRFNPAKEDIRFSARTDEQRQALFDKAKAQFGLTNNFNAAGYMLPDGSLLDFSEANNGGNPNQRSLDHREIEGIIMDEGREYDSRWMYLADFMNEGAIRLLPEYAGINLMKAPTKEQRQKLFDFIYKYNGEVILEIADERLNNVAYVEYDRRTSPSRIFRDIDGYFNEGIVPEQDVRFSVRTVNQTAQEFHNEMDRIAATAIFDGNYMLAPNGQPTKLTADQWAMVRTENFKRWFGDWINDPENASKVVDENGEPKVVYHGSNWRPVLDEEGKAIFKMRSGMMGRGAYFTDNIYTALYFAADKYEMENGVESVSEGFLEENGYISEVFLNIRNEENIRTVLEDTYYLATDPNQIKSATDNTGEFSESGDIRFSTRFDVNTNPTEAQKKAGNYKMGHLRLDGYNITIENPKGSVRRGTDSKGNEWKNTLNNDYGYIRGTEGVDGDHIDVYLSDNPAEGNVFVVDQVNPETREFDEHKVMYGFNSEEEARNAYLANFSEGWNGLGTITEVTKDEFRKWIDSSHRKTKPFSEYKSVKTDILDEGDIRYSLVTDPALLERLESGPTIKVYRAMQLVDGKLYPPMSAKVDGKMREPIELGKWEQAEERPDLADEKGYFKLDKGNKTSLKARYNPYFHTSPTPLNDQFSSAQKRPELVTIEVEVPESELTSGYKAEKAKDSVGKMEWKAGVIQGKLSGTRTVILSRWDKPVRIVPDGEVADKIVEMFEGKDITMPSNVVTPSLRTELEMRGVPFVETDNQGKPTKNEDVSFSVIATPTDKVVAEGMQFSFQDFARLAGNIFQDMPESSRKEAIEETFKNGMDMQSAIFQIPARLAEKENWDEVDKGLAKVIRERVQDAMDESGVVMSRPLTTKEALWMLYRSISGNGNDLISAARRSLVARYLGFDLRSERIREMADDHIRLSVVRNDMIDAATDMYNYEASLWTNRLKESWLDMNQSVINLQKALAEASGKPIEPWENIELALNQLSSRSYADKKRYMRDFLKPLWDVVLEIVKKTNYRIEDIERYMMLKHALERNEIFAKRDAKEFYRSMFDRVAEKMKNQSIGQQKVALSDTRKALAEIDAKITEASGSQLKRLKESRAKAQLEFEIAELVVRGSEKQNEADLQAYYDAIDAGSNPKYLEFREKDYGGLTSMFTDFDKSAVKSRKNYKSEEAYQQAVIAATKPRYTSVADMEQAAKDEVDVIENDIAGLSAELWSRVNAATKEVLRHQHASGMITTEQYNAVRNMFQHYVPLRGFADNTAEDMYSYYMNNSSNGFAMPIIGAKGRKTKAESPLGWIGTMAESAIQADNKNDVKMRLYYALLNRPETGVLSIAETWYEYTGKKDANGKKVFAPAYPPATGKAMTADELRQHMDTWEASMRQKQASGEAFSGNQSVNLRGSVVFQDAKEDKEHIIRVKVAGKDYSILVNGNPRAAQAINGLLNPDANIGPIGEWIGNLRRGMSALMTSFSPLFWISNYQRDLLSSFMRTSESEGWNQAFKYLNNRRKAWRVASYIYKYDNGTLGNSYYKNLYKEFAENGGITGYTSLTTNKEYEKLLEDYAKFADKKTLKAVKNAWKNFMGFGEAIEQVSRFAAYITAKEAGKSIEEAVNAAKEVSVNFNRKGSAKPISLDELDKLRTKDGKPLNKAQKVAAIVLSAMPKWMKELYFFFNASIQALSSSAKLAKQSPGKAITWAGMYMGMSMALAAINYLISGDDDEEEYLNLPDYVRRSNALVKLSDEYYLKWSLPQEMRPFYAIADIILSKTAGNMPHKNVGKEIALSMAEWLPVNPFGTEDPLLSLVPDFVAPLAEIKANKNFVGGKIYDDMAFKSEGEKENIPAYRKATSNTGKVYVDVAELLNTISGGNDVQKGAININPAIVEHLVEGYGGGLYDFAKMMVSFPAMFLSDEGVEVRDIPFVNKVVMSVDETNMYTHTNEVFYHYRDIAENAERVEKEYRNSDDPSRADAYRQEEDWRIHLLFEQYDAELKEIKEKLKNAADKEEEDLLKQSQNAVRELLLNDIATGKEPDPVLAMSDAVKDIAKEISAIKKPYNDAEKRRKKAKEAGDAEGARKAKAERDDIRKSDAYKMADKAGKDLKELRNLLDKIMATSSAEDRDSLVAKFQGDYRALKEKLESR